MKVFITGGTGFLGGKLVERLSSEGHEIIVMSRSKKAGSPSAPIRYIKGDPVKPGEWQDSAADCDVLINLAGASIFHKWTPGYKKRILESRVKTTRRIGEAIGSHPRKSRTLINGSAVGYYGFRADEGLGEDAAPGNDFLAGVVGEWESEAKKAEALGARVVMIRTGLVLDAGGGALGQMVPFFKFYIGGPLGSGRQWFSWVHRDDYVEAVLFVMGHQELAGPVNVCSPCPIRNRELAAALGRAVGRPSWLRAPGFAVRFILGEFGTVVLNGQRVLPRKLLDHGFVFRYPDIDGALGQILGG